MKSKKKKRLVLTPFEYLDQFIISVFFLISPAFFLWSLIELHVLDSYDGVRSMSELGRVNVPFIGISGLTFLIKWRQLKLKFISCSNERELLIEALNRSVREKGWMVENNNQLFIHAETPYYWTKMGSAQRITIIPISGGVLFGSMPSLQPHFFKRAPSLFSFGHNSKAKRIFFGHLEMVIANQPYQPVSHELDDYEKPEWSFKRILTRILAYPLALLFVFLFGVFVYFELGIASYLIGFIAALIGLVYLISDIKILIKKSNENSNG